MNVPPQDIQQDFMVYVIKESLDVKLDHPAVAVSSNQETDALNGVMRAAIRPESIAVRVLFPFVDGLQNATYRILCRAIDDSGNSERPFFMWLMVLRDENPPHGTR